MKLTTKLALAAVAVTVAVGAVSAGLLIRNDGGLAAPAPAAAQIVDEEGETSEDRLQEGGPTPAPVVQQAASTDAQTISVVGFGSVTAIPDLVDIRVGVTTIRDDAGDAVRANDELMMGVTEAIRALGVAETDVKTTQLNMWAERQYGPEGPTNVVRYNLTNVVLVRLRDVDMAGDLLSAATAAGANTIEGISYTIEDPSELQRRAREEAVDDARERAQHLASLLGATVGSVNQVVEINDASTVGVSIGERLGSGGGFGGGGGPSVSGGKIRVNSAVRVVFHIIE